MRGKPALALLVLMALAAALRGYRLGQPALSRDEAFSWRVSRDPPLELLSRVAGDTHPPGHFVLLKAWMAAAGDSPAALRLLSLVCGVLLVPAMYALVREALASDIAGRRAANEQSGSESARTCAALLSAGLVALHAGQIEQARIARMYSLGALLAALSAWLLLKAMAADRQRHGWWSAYGAVAALFLYSHHYALFTLAAQALFVAGCLAWRAWRNPRHAAETAAGAALGGGVALALYSPWLPVFWAQATRVREGFWIPGPTWEQATQWFFAWLTGVEYLAAPERIGWALVLGAVVAWAAWKRDRAAWFFLLQGAVPWLLALYVSFAGDRPILQDRYLALAQISVPALWGVVYFRLPRLPERLLWAWLLVSYAAYGAWFKVCTVPPGPPAIARATGWLAENYRAGDLVLAASPADVNLLRYYSGRAGMRQIDVRCHVNLFTKGQESHISSVHVEDIILWERGEPPREVHRIWVADGGSNPGDGWDLSERKEFTGASQSWQQTVKLLRYERRSAK